ncbi:glutathione transferase GstA [Pelagibius sp. 7325]|uniref:glutathione transferase GstA n=1 Tax=Pelagibius sp. 7325 TaxID=3131994 RepID=UPI0030EC11D9
MKLYYLPGACSLAPHIALREVGATFELDRLDKASKKTESGVDFLTVNPKGYVPALSLDDGDLLTENASILQFIADANPSAALAPAAGTRERVRLQEHLNFIATELHKSFSPLFAPGSSDEMKAAARKKVAQRLDLVEKWLADGRSYLLGDTFSVADAYLFTVVNWTFPTSISLAPWPHVAAYHQRVAARDSVKAALKAEGLAA